MRLISETLRKLRIYEKEYRKGTLGRMIEGTEDILKEAADAIEKMSEKLKENNLNNAWIPCSERLPKPYELVLIQNIHGVVSVASRTGERWFNFQGTELWQAIAWQPLPEPYKE